MKAILMLSLFFLTQSSFGQLKMSPAETDSILTNTSYTNSYHYFYGDGAGVFEDFKMDTINGRLLKYAFVQKLKDTFQIEYFFIDNYLAKVTSSHLSKERVVPVATYYFTNNKTTFKIGKNIDLKGNKTFGKISPKQFDRQLEHIYYQYEYLNPNRKRLNKTVPELLEIEQLKIDKRN